jgi:phosphate transport system substrate-binding protein
MKTKNLVIVIAIIGILLLSVGYWYSTTAGQSLSGTIEIDGSSTVFPITQAVAEEFSKEHPDIRVNVGVSGTGGGFKRFQVGETDINDASRPIKSSEAEACANNGIEYIEFTIAIDGLAVMVNPQNTWVDYLTVEELNLIWKPDSPVENWNDIRPEWPDEEIGLYGPDTDSGTFDYFTDVINGDEGVSRSDYTASADDNLLVQGIAGDKNSLGYFGYAYYAENTDKLKIVPIDSGNGPVIPSDETVRAGQYTPLARPIFIYVNKASLNTDVVNSFVRFYMENAEWLVAEVGYTPQPSSVYQNNLAEL